MPKVPYKGKQVDAIEVSFKVDREDWNQYQLADGSELRMRLIVRQVFFLPGEFDDEGNPVYSVSSGNMLMVNAPDHMRRPTS